MDIFIIVCIYMDDRLNITNSKELYEWVLGKINKWFQVKDSGATSLYLGIQTNRHRCEQKLWLLQKEYILNLLATYCLLDATPLLLLLAGKLNDSPEPPANAILEVADDNIKVCYQWLVGSILYLCKGNF